MRHFTILPSLALLCLLPLSAPLHATDDPAPIARVGDTEVSAADIRAEIANLDPKVQAQVASDPTALSQVVRALLTQRLVLKVALAKNWDKDPAAIAAIDRMRDGVISETYLQSISKPPDSYPSDAEIQAAYDANKQQMVVPRQFKLAQIFIKVAKGADPATAAKAQVKLVAVRKELAKPDADFAAIARAESDEPDSAAKGGEMGWMGENRIQPEIRSRLESLSKGTVADPMRLDDGWHILKMLDVKESYTPTLDQIRPELVQQMRAAKERANTQDFIAKLTEENPIQINELGLSKVLQK